MTAVPESNKLTAEEYLKTPETNRHVELRDGVIVDLASPTETHQTITLRLASAVDSYIRSNHGKCRAMIAPFDVVLDDYTVVQPDVLIVCDPSKMDGKRCNGAPDWIVEVLSSNRDDDLIHKLALYKQAGVREYWIVDPKNEKTLVYFFERNDLPDIYTFDTPIPVEIYDRKLEIRIADLV